MGRLRRLPYITPPYLRDVILPDAEFLGEAFPTPMTSGSTDFLNIKFSEFVFGVLRSFSVSALLFAIQQVFVVCAKDKVVRVHASRVIAFVHNTHFFRHFSAVAKYPRHLVGVHPFASEKVLPIGVLFCDIIPRPAAGSFGNSLPKPRFIGQCLDTHRFTFLQAVVRGVIGPARLATPRPHTWSLA